MTHPIKEFVDHIYVLTCTKYRNTRAVDLMGYLKEIGLDDITDLMIQTGSPFDMLIKKHISPVNSGAAQDYVVDIFLNHYRAIKTGYTLGYSRILILEDDAAILNDTAKIEACLKELTDTTVCAVLDYGAPLDQYEEAVSRCPLHNWGCHSGVRFNGAHAYILNRVGMERWISYCENTIVEGNSRKLFDAADRIWPYLLSGDEKILFPVTPIAIQVYKDMSTKGPCSGGWESAYRQRNIDISLYSPYFGIPFTVVYASNGDDYRRLEMSTFSIRKYFGTRVRIVLLTDSDKIPNVSNIIIVNPRKVLSDIGFHDNGWNRKWPYATLFRMAIPLLDCFNECDRVLYLDTDVLCRSDSAKILTTMDLRGYESWSAFDHESKMSRIPDIMNSELCQEAKAGMAVKLWAPRGTEALTYSNAGVVLYNLKAIRENDIEWYKQRLRWFWEAECRGKFFMLDQDFLNIMMDNNPGLNKRYNWFGGDKNTNCVFQHFVSASKPNMEPTARFLGWK